MRSPNVIALFLILSLFFWLPLQAEKTEETKSPKIVSAVADLDAATVVITGDNLHDYDGKGNPVEPTVTLNGEGLFVTSYSLVEIRADLPLPALDFGTYQLTVAHAVDSKSYATCDLTIGGDITAATVGPGLIGGGDAGNVSFEVDFAGRGNADAVARSDHDHDGADITHGIVIESSIDEVVARDFEVMPTVLANDGPGSSLDADTLDGVEGAAYLSQLAAPPCFDNSNRFVDCGNGTVMDTELGLIWLKEADCFGPGHTWADGNAIAAALADGQCGLTDDSSPGDWRLPTRAEWEGILEPDCGYPTFPNTVGSGCYANGPEWTNGIPWTHYWTSTAGGPDGAWYARTGPGDIQGFPKTATDNMRIWPVRSGR